MRATTIDGVPQRSAASVPAPPHRLASPRAEQRLAAAGVGVKARSADHEANLTLAALAVTRIVVGVDVGCGDVPPLLGIDRALARRRDRSSRGRAQYRDAEARPTGSPPAHGRAASCNGTRAHLDPRRVRESGVRLLRVRCLADRYRSRRRVPRGSGPARAARLAMSPDRRCQPAEPWKLSPPCGPPLGALCGIRPPDYRGRSAS